MGAFMINGSRRISRSSPLVTVVVAAVVAVMGAIGADQTAFATASSDSAAAQQSAAEDSTNEDSTNDDDPKPCESAADVDLRVNVDAAGCAVKQWGLPLLLLAAMSLVAYALAALVLRVIPLRSNTGVLGTLRRAREQLPLVGRAYRPKIEIQVTPADGVDVAVKNTVTEMFVDEMNAVRTPGIDERLVEDQTMPNLSAALDTARPGLGKLWQQVATRLPQERFTARIQLHQPRADQVAMTVELLKRNKHSIGTTVFQVAPPKVEDRALIGYQLLVPRATAWLRFALHNEWPRDEVKVPRPFNTTNAESYGEFRAGVVYESLGLVSEARAAYHRAIDADPANVGALLNLALVDSRDPSRIRRCLSHLNDADAFVNDVTDDSQRSQLRLHIRYVRAVANLNSLVWASTRLRDSAGPRDARLLAPLADATTSLQSLARHVCRAPRTTQRRWRLAETDLLTLSASYHRRTAALAAGLAVEQDLILGTRPRSVKPTARLSQALAQLAGGQHIDFFCWERLLVARHDPLTTPVAYSLACAYARRDSVEQALELLREALAGAPQLSSWALTEDPAFAALRERPAFRALSKEFSTSAR
jgi:tetratricopeptide (TPR) repeat protein